MKPDENTDNARKVSERMKVSFKDAVHGMKDTGGSIDAIDMMMFDLCMKHVFQWESSSIADRAYKFL